MGLIQTLAKIVIILLSDGEQDTNNDDFGNPISQATSAKNDGIRIIIIGLEPDQDSVACSQPLIICRLDKETLTSIASSPSDFHHAPTYTDLRNIYEEIAIEVGCSGGRFIYPLL